MDGSRHGSSALRWQSGPAGFVLSFEKTIDFPLPLEGDFIHDFRILPQQDQENTDFSTGHITSFSLSCCKCKWNVKERRKQQCAAGLADK